MFNSNRVQLVRKSFSFFITVHWINVLHQLTSVGRMSFQMDVMLKEVSHLGQRKDSNTALLLTT